MPQITSWVGDDNWAYSYVQSDAGNYALRTRKVNDILTVEHHIHVGANLTNPEVEELFD
jgi:hypothetical protein